MFTFLLCKLSHALTLQESWMIYNLEKWELILWNLVLKNTYFRNLLKNYWEQIKPPPPTVPNNYSLRSIIILFLEFKLFYQNKYTLAYEKNQLYLSFSTFSCPKVQKLQYYRGTYIIGNISCGYQPLHENYENLNMSHMMLIQEGTQEKWERRFARWEAFFFFLQKSPLPPPLSAPMDQHRVTQIELFIVST